MIVSKVQKQPKLKKPSAIPASVAASAARVQALQNRITERAFEIYEMRGSCQGHHMQDWLRGERQILAL